MDKLPQSFKTFEDLEAYQIARQFRKTMYGVAKRLPKFEMFDLGSQIRRAAISLSNNIAEGHGRYHFPDQLRFVLQARGSLEELIDDLNICLDEEYLLVRKSTLSNSKPGGRIILSMDTPVISAAERPPSQSACTRKTFLTKLKSPITRSLNHDIPNPFNVFNSFNVLTF